MTMNSSTRWLVTLCIGFGLPIAAVMMGCGCYYGEAGPVTIQPATDCLDIVGTGSCAWLEMSGTNGCEEELVFTPDDDSPVVRVAPGGSFAMDDVTPYADMETDDAYCYTDVVVEAQLGDDEVTIFFVVERINRGLRAPCD